MNKEELMNRAQKAQREVNRRKIELEGNETNILGFIAKGYDSWTGKNGEEFLNDFESVYNINGVGLRRPSMPGDKKSYTEGVKVHHGANGEIFELSSKAKVADVLKSGPAPEVSLDRWLAAAMLGDRCEDKIALEFAQENSKSLSTGTSGTLIPIGYQGTWLDNLRANMVLQACGMTTAVMNAGTVTSSRVVSDPTVTWRAEAVPISESDPTFELQNLVSKTLGVRCRGTMELAQDSPDFGTQLLNVMSRSLAQEIDRVGLVGSGTGSEPRGILNTVGINTVPVDAAMANYAPFVNGLKSLLNANVPLEAIEKNAVMSPRTWAELENLTATDDQPLMPPRCLEDMEFRPTTSIPDDMGVGTDESAVILGDFRDLVMGVRAEASVEALKLSSWASNLQIEYIGWTRVDFLVRRPTSFCALTGIG